MSRPDNSGLAKPWPGSAADETQFRDVIRHLASGVTVVTSSLGGEPVGLTATAVCSVSATPPSLLVSLTANTRTAQGVVETDAFAVHLLPFTARGIAEQFASSRSHFEAVHYSVISEKRIPLLTDVVGWLLCHVKEKFWVEDHLVFVGRVVGCELKDTAPDPLLYLDRNYRRLLPGAERGAENLEPWGSSQDVGLPGFGW